MRPGRDGRRVLFSTLLVATLLLALPAPVSAAPPVCGIPAPQTAHDGSSLSIYLGATCQDADLDFLTYSILTAPAHGDLTGPPDVGWVDYTPDAGFTGTDSFEFRASDGTAFSEVVMMQITVEPNRAPECPEELFFDVEPDTPTSFFDPVALFGCWDPDFSELTYSVVDHPQHGTVSAYEPDVGFTYTPTSGYVGPDSFTFKASDGLDDSNPTTMRLTVLGPNHPPRCVTPLTLRVAPGGSFPLDPLLACTDTDNDRMIPRLVSGPSHGSLTFPNGAVTYVADANYVGSDQIVYQVSDPRGATSNTAILNIIIARPPGLTKTAPPRQPTTTADTTAPVTSTALAVGQKLRAVRARGLKLILSSSEAGRGTVRAFVSKATARRLKLKRNPQRPVLIGSAERALQAGSNTITVTLTAKAKKALRRVRRVKLSLVTVATDPAGNRGTQTRTVTLRR